jgi:hypothetical protein
MRIDSPKMTNAEATGSFKGSFSGSFFGDIQADSVAFENITNVPNGIISGSASDARAQLGVIIGTDVQGYADNLNDIAGLNASDGSFIVGNGSAFVAESGATVRTSLGLGTFAEISSLAYGDLTSIPAGIVSSSAQIDELFNVDGLISGSSLSSAAQGEVTLTTNGVDALAVDLGLQSSDSPTFAGLTVNGAITVTGNVDGRDLSADGTKLDGIESGADVTDATNVEAAGALMDSEVDADIKTLSLPANTTISSFGASLVDDADAAAARTTLGVDAAGTDNSTDVTLAGTRDYITISGQTITRNVIDISDDTNLAVSDTTGQTGINLTLSGDTISGVVSGLTTTSNVTFASLTTTGNATIEGNLVVEGTTQTINTETLAVEDNMIYLNSGSNVTNPDLGFAGNYNDGTYAHAGLFSDASDSHTFKFYKGYTPEPDAAAHIDTTHASFTLADIEAAGIAANGNITVTGTVDGRDVAADGTKLDGIESGADVTDTANVTAAGALMDSEVDADIKTLSLPANTTISAFGKTLVDDADAEAARTTLGLGTAATTAATAYATSAQGTTADNALPKAGGQMTGNITFSGAQTVDGRDLSADGTKLDGIATGANNYTHPTHTARSIDTTGAEVLDVFTSDTSGHVTNISKRTMTLADLGYTGAANANNYAITQDNTSNVHFEGLMVGQISGATANTIRCTGDIVAYYSSDAQFKDNVQQLEGALDKVKQIRGVSFDWNDKQDVYEGHDIGVIAQEVEAVYPELVHERDYNNSKAVDYVKLTAVLIEAVKELSAKVDELEKKCNC